MLVTSDHIETTAMDYFYGKFSRKCIRNAVLLPNAYFDGRNLHGFVLDTDFTVIPEVLGCKAGRGTMIVKTDIDVHCLELNKDMIRNNLKAIEFNGGIGNLGSGDFVSIGVDKRGIVYIIVRGGSSFHGNALEKKYNRILNKKKGKLLGFGIGSKGYAEYIFDYKVCVANSKKIRWLVASTVIKEIEKFLDFVVIKNDDILTNYITTSETGLVYRVGASEAGGIGVICGNMATSAYLIGSKDTTELIHSYPSGLGKTIGNPMAKDSVNKQTLKLEMKGIEGWVDDQTDLEAPFNYKNVETIRDDCYGAVFSVDPIKAIINIRG